MAMLDTVALVIIVFALCALRQYLIVILGVATLYAYHVFGSDPARYVVLDAWHALNRDILLSIPLFILAGRIMAQGSMAARLVNLVRSITAPIPGGLAIATVLSCAVFAAISGSSTVTLLAVGQIMYPALLKAGYAKSFALGAICAAGTLGIVVPPSIPLILYGVMTHTSISDLFIAGILPALVLTVLMCSYALWVNRDRDTEPFQLTEVIYHLRRGALALFMPVLILGGIYSGHFTATESAAVAVVYALLVEIFIHREVTLRDAPVIAQETTKVLGSLFPVLLFAVSLNTLMTYEQVPATTVALVSEHIQSQTGFLVVTNAFLLLVGTIMDIGSAILVLAPLLEPIATALGSDPIHFGIIMIVNLEIGYLTPPFGLNLIVAMGAFNESFWQICKSVVPFLILMLIGLVIVTLVPYLSLALLG